MNKHSFLTGLLLITIFLSMDAYLSVPAITVIEEKEIEVKTEPNKEDEDPKPSWSYEGETGPDKWGSLDPAFSTCADGKEQSPINIEDSKVNLGETLGDIKFNYHPTSFTVANTGQTIQANDVTGRNSIIVEGKEYKLLQMHFHYPSEHQINGETFAMEGHLVHKNNEGNLAVLGFFIITGKENKELAEIWSKLPKQVTKKDIKLNKPVDLVHLLPKNKKYFLYDGSLTTPPCTEGVKWVVLEQPIELSKDQITAFSAIFPDNHRPVQPLNNRFILTNER